MVIGSEILTPTAVEEQTLAQIARRYRCLMENIVLNGSMKRWRLLADADEELNNERRDGVNEASATQPSQNGGPLVVQTSFHVSDVDGRCHASDVKAEIHLVPWFSC